MNQYETTFIVTPVLPQAELEETIKTHLDFLKNNKAEIIHEDKWGLRQLAYPINKKTTGFYFLVEFKSETSLIDRLELNLKRDENIMRFLTVRLDRDAIEYNDRKRKGLIGQKKETGTDKQEA